MHEIPTKKCKHCEKEKMLMDFNRDLKNPNNYFSRCKSCIKMTKNKTILQKLNMNDQVKANGFINSKARKLKY